MPRIGAHVSAAGGAHKAVERAHAIGADCVQVFSGSPRGWKRKPIDQVDAAAVFAAQQATGINPVVTHALYLTNLASENPEQVQKTIDAIVYDLEFDALLGGSGVVVHLGSHQGRGWETVRDQTADAMAQILERAPRNGTFLMENSAGQQGKLSSNLEELRWLLDRLQAPNLGWCFDTCHAHAAGLYMGDPADAGARRSAITEIDRLQLWDTLKVIHVNDSRDPFDSGRDRHANLGEGQIPAEDLRCFLRRPELQKLPFILEVPGFAGEGPDAENIRRLRELAEG
ncbi:deoxyribonuclease IV [Spirochaeta africana]|uniref:Probable endonuclease 4 n=1 Tax=Spirochaeta africana (strain ATCC 700263 / DSM 8902 / Z-7692) TaxID=889378 RepID=H9UG14_SPIAZ|nr:deoxyribonuclease IV [Spirochaeta africana]AFG36457.1 apurinic endonuclease APN1 [Spirochaeta africana DSM 8902]